VEHLVISIGTTVVTMLMAVPADYALGAPSYPGKRCCRFYILATQMLPPVGIIIPYFLICGTSLDRTPIRASS
jgi:multiple sugar transport system permease protein